ncbi:MAG: hypothetical protein M3Q30_02880 [Actinomycetota bacterium]|nr:hypothetical protein [Actinomycetota bacterium]
MIGTFLQLPNRWRARVAVLATVWVAVGGGGFAALRSAGANTPVSGAAFTTVNENYDGTGHCQNGNPNVNCNIYDGKEFVWMNGGPSVAYVGDGSYFFAVLSPGGQADPNDGAAKNLSDDFDAYTNRTFGVSGATVTYGGSHLSDSNKIRLSDYADTFNPGGVYIMALCSLADGYPVTPSKCKYDAFKVQQGEPQPPLDQLTITKDAAGSYKDAFTWTIKKSVDKTLVKKSGGTATFNYTVTVEHDAGTISEVKVTGTIDVFNPNVDTSNNTVPVDIDGVTDQLSDGTTCTVTDGGPQALTTADTLFAYECDLSSLPQGQLDNTAAVSWGQQFSDDGRLLDAGSADFTFKSISFTATNVDDCVNVSDTNAAGPLSVKVCVGDPNPKTFNYPVTVNVPSNTCVVYDNTATFTTNTTQTSDHASQQVEVCGPVRGGLTMGFWQNKNGQAIVTGQAKTGVCPSTAWLRQFAPFQDLASTSTCAQVAAYDTKLFNAASAAGAAMNAMLKAQMLSTALNVYFSDPTLGGNKIGAPTPLGGVKTDLTQVNAPPGSASYVNARPAFNNVSCQTVLADLTYAASQSNAGGTVWYGQVKATQELAKDTFDAINNAVAFSCI